MLAAPAAQQTPNILSLAPSSTANMSPRILALKPLNNSGASDSPQQFVILPQPANGQNDLELLSSNQVPQISILSAPAASGNISPLIGYRPAPTVTSVTSLATAGSAASQNGSLTLQKNIAATAVENPLISTKAVSLLDSPFGLHLMRRQNVSRECESSWSAR